MYRQAWIGTVKPDGGIFGRRNILRERLRVLRYREWRVIRDKFIKNVENRTNFLCEVLHILLYGL